MSWYTLKWINRGAPLETVKVNGRAAVKAQIVKWVNQEFGDDGDQIHVTEEATQDQKRKRHI